jgi:NhaP-type Na+/H+ or K+/H+ antiporter
MLFLFGTIAGIGTVRLMNEHDLAVSMKDFWIPINGEILLLIFLPGLVFKDASSLSIHLFQKSIGQCLIFAFPMVLAGTVLTALTAFYIFPYDWSFNLCMTFGSILSATDPGISAKRRITVCLSAFFSTTVMYSTLSVYVFFHPRLTQWPWRPCSK